MKAPHPAVLVFQLQAERRVDAETKGELIVDRQREISGRDCVPTARIATLAAQRLAERGLRVLIVELRLDEHAARHHQKLRLRELRQARGIVENRTGIVGRGRRAGECGAESARALFEQREAGCKCTRRRKTQKHAHRQYVPAACQRAIHRKSADSCGRFMMADQTLCNRQMQENGTRTYQAEFRAGDACEKAKREAIAGCETLLRQ